MFLFHDDGVINLDNITKVVYSESVQLNHYNITICSIDDDTIDNVVIRCKSREEYEKCRAKIEHLMMLSNISSIDKIRQLDKTNIDHMMKEYNNSDSIFRL